MRLIRRLRALFGREKLSADLEEELRFHLAMREQLNAEEGMPRADAREDAVRRFGNITRTKEAMREIDLFTFPERIGQDIRLALRGFRRNPAFTVTAIATLALGIGATTAVFSAVDRILFRALPYAQADRIVSVGLVQSLEREEFMTGGFYFDWLDHQRPFAAMASQGTMVHPCDLVENNPVRLGCIPIQAGFLPMLDISPVLGHNFLPFEDQPGGPRVALISYSLWSVNAHRKTYFFGLLPTAW